jgi:type I restriction enzyme S subunit
MSTSKKQSGIEWIGLVPSHWKIVPFKFCYTNSNAGEVIDKSHWHDGNELLYTCQRTPMRSSFSEFPSTKRTTSNDLLLTRNGTPYVHLPIKDSIYSNVVQRVKLNQEINREFARYMLGSAAKQLRGSGDIIESFNMGTWNEAIFLLPPKKEQKNLVMFIDNKTTLIDSKISNFEKSILLLKEKRTALIAQAVTKGLDLDVPVKESVIDSIGEIPSHWDEIRLKNIIRRVSRPIVVDTNQSYREIGIRSWGKGIFHKDPIKGNLLGNKKVFNIKPGDLVLNIVFAWEGAVALVSNDEEGMIASHRFPTFRCNQDLVLVDYILLFLQSKYGRAIMGFNSPGAAGRNRTIRIGSFLDEVIPLPPLEEQRRILNSVRRYESLGHQLQSVISPLVKKVKEYRLELISAAVTGKIELQSP